MAQPKNPATLETMSSSLTSEFGLSWAIKLFGEEAIASLPRHIRGKHAGKPKGYVIWRKATKGGWAREVQGVVAHGSLVDAWIGVSPLMKRSEALQGQWLGRVQSLGGAASYMFEEGRARVAQEQALDAATRLDGDIAFYVAASPELRETFCKQASPAHVAQIRAAVAERHPEFKDTI